MEAQEIINALIEKRPGDVSLLCKKYNFFGIPTSQNVLDLFIIHGDPFLMDLFNLYYENQNQFGGKLFGKVKGLLGGKSSQEPFYPTPTGAPIGTEEGKEKKSLWDKFKDGFDKAKGILSGVSSILSPILGNNNKPQPALKPEEKKILGMNQGLFIGLVVVVVLIVVVVIVKKK
jgi:hypothetical protein